MSGSKRFTNNGFVGDLVTSRLLCGWQMTDESPTTAQQTAAEERKRKKYVRKKYTFF
jgi:hypothetical protein